jgi:hypothetical protein
MADLLGFAQDLWDEGQDDSSLLAKLKSERAALSEAIRKGTNVGDIIMGSKNGASYTSRIGFTINDRLTAMRYAIRGLESGIRPGNVTRQYFL